MEKWNRKKLIKEYIEFFKSKKHKEIANFSLVPEHDSTVLFTTAGMHPLVPFLLGQRHTAGKRLVNVQKCIRTGDIDEVGDAVHHTFFEMLGNWSLGDYFKKEAIDMSYEFLTRILKIPIKNLSVSCFAGDKDAPKDEESAKIWKNLGIKKIKFLPKSDNWWIAGETGPCGPDTEMFVNGVEIWNDVFMQYNKTKEGRYEILKQKNVDTGMGVERTLAILNNLDDNYLTDSFLPIIKEIEKLSGKKYGKDEGETRAMRIIADHIKASVFIIADGILPGNVERGYVLRRLIRRAVRYGKELGIKDNFTCKVAIPVFQIYDDYEILRKNKTKITEELEKEEEKFRKTIEEGLKAAEKLFSGKIPIERKKFIKLMQLPNHQEILKELWNKKREGKDYSIKEANISEKEIDNATITGKEGFLLYQSFGFPAEMILELSREKNLLFYRGEFRIELEKHQELSRTSSSGVFKSGLADSSEETTKLHTATHLLNQALREILKEDIHQKGSNITAERLRFDFNFPRKLTADELEKVENLVNKKIKEKLDVKCEKMNPEEAKKKGAQGVFDSKYREKVKVYSIANFSKEICAGPHVKNTGELEKFKIIKEEAVAAGVRRIKAILE